MSVCRFDGDSDVYVYFGIDGGICCSRCLLESGNSFNAPAERDMLAHLRMHENAGHKVPASAFEELAAVER
jgi:hypothetical protein